MRRTGRGARATSRQRPEPGALGREGPAAQPSHADARSKLAAALHLVATPIGNVGDLSPRALATLRDADVVACEDTRVTGGLLRRHGVTRPLVAYHEHNAERVRPELLARLCAGASVALASDAGTPLVSDPGYKLVRAAIGAGIGVLAVPGPSAALAALTVSGLPPDRFLFNGFLPARAEARRRAIGELAAVPATLVLFESARRLPATLADLAGALGPHREAAVARELTKLFEEVRRGRLDELAAHYAAAGPPKGEVAVVVGPPPPAGATADEAEVERALARALEEMSPAAAAAAVAAATGRPRREIYRRALALRRGEER
ncbi:MAG TPA: 16S rRNA (cytidine(1402)-2'-O)-methyltransferase [Geminicoccaceae bacterium]|nr:16S rRNA (cytidine(1402)-2'-O)-methyltransferase [Geminicoccaceae bacterium]